jgi:DNA (cytosine-5)-methyltransferase 1
MCNKYFPEVDMAKPHVTVPDELHDAVKKKATEYNYSIQEVTEKLYALFIKEPQLLFSFTKNEPYNSQPLFIFIDLFAGIGGIRIAFEKNGGQCVYSSEWDRWCRKTYLENFGEMPDGDINEAALNEIPNHDILTAGFPCQPFSIAGVSKKKSLGREHGFKDKAQGTLFFKIAEILEAKRPKAFMLENVKNLRNHDKGNTFSVIEGTLEELDYVVFSEIIDAANYVPQHRERLFIIGFDRKVFGDFPDFSFSAPPKARPTLNSILEKKVDPKYILSDHLWNYLKAYAEKHKKKGNGFGYGLCDGESVARTLSARYYKDGSEILIKVPGSNPRRLTPRECARLMGFDDSFRIPVSDTQAYKQFGNAVAVPVVASVATAILKTCMPVLSSGKSL